MLCANCGHEIGLDARFCQSCGSRVDIPSVALSKALREVVCGLLARSVAELLWDGELSEDEASEVSTYILDRLDRVESRRGMIDFLRDIGQRWPAFRDALPTAEFELAAEEDEMLERLRRRDLEAKRRLDAKFAHSEPPAGAAAAGSPPEVSATTEVPDLVKTAVLVRKAEEHAERAVTGPIDFGYVRAVAEIYKDEARWSVGEGAREVRRRLKVYEEAVVFAAANMQFMQQKEWLDDFRFLATAGGLELLRMQLPNLNGVLDAGAVERLRACPALVRCWEEEILFQFLSNRQARVR